MRKNEFFKWVLAVLCGLLVWGIVKAIFFIMMIGSLAGSAANSSGSSTLLPKEGILLMDMSSLVITEQTTESMPSMSLSSLGGASATTPVGLYDAVNAIHKAAEDPGVKLILLKSIKKQ